MVQPHVLVLVGATGDLSRRKLLPGLFRLTIAGLMKGCRVIGTSLDDLSDEAFVKIAREACEESLGDQFDEDAWTRYATLLSYVSQSAGPEGLAAAVAEAERGLGDGADGPEGADGG
ncbi:MAG: glucose-6-phosphate dehydrogenase, partial [Nocardioidaceae bacterium]